MIGAGGDQFLQSFPDLRRRAVDTGGIGYFVIAVDERFTTPALPLIGLFAGARISDLVGRRQAVAVRYAA